MNNREELSGGKVRNYTHDLQQWRQRLQNEAASKRQWQESWGKDCPADNLRFISSEAIEETKARAAPIYSYLQKRHADEQAAKAARGEPVDENARCPHSITRPECEAMRPQVWNGVGSTISTVGIDPVKKYSFPQTTSQTYGWSASAPLEKLVHWDNSHGKKGMQLDYAPTVYPPLDPNSAEQQQTLNDINAGHVIYSRRLH
jgi:hypothetical protein